jgi:hypothetical protein
MRVVICAAVCAAFTSTPAFAHGIVGNRFFPATLAIDDPAVADELSFPTIAGFKPDPDTRELDVSGEYSKRLTPRLGVSIESGWTRLTGGGAKLEGFQNLETSVKYQFLTDAAHELIVSGAIDVEWGGTGADRVGAEEISAVAPTLFFGKGAGDLPERLNFLRPLAVTGAISYETPTKAHEDTPAGPEETTQSLLYGFTLQYSLPYLNGRVRQTGWPDFFNQLTPIVEARFESPVVNSHGERTTGAIQPGFIWANRKMQIGVEAIIPINSESGDDVGVIAQWHLYLDDLMPHSLGKPIWSD